jgi:protein-L-isoaspartate(D-aspartate) O-methyltransferase
LEIGTGSGYQTAFLAEFSGQVTTVERISELSELAQERLAEMGYRNIVFRIGDGSRGLPESGPFDRIMVTAAARTVPPELLRQLAPCGRMVIPAGPEGSQELLLITKDAAEAVRQETVGAVRFVEMVGDYGWQATDPLSRS